MAEAVLRKKLRREIAGSFEILWHCSGFMNEGKANALPVADQDITTVPPRDHEVGIAKAEAQKKLVTKRVLAA